MTEWLQRQQVSGWKQRKVLNQQPKAARRKRDDRRPGICTGNRRSTKNEACGNDGGWKAKFILATLLGNRKAIPTFHTARRFAPLTEKNLSEGTGSAAQDGLSPKTRGVGIGEAIGSWTKVSQPPRGHDFSRIKFCCLRNTDKRISPVHTLRA